MPQLLIDLLHTNKINYSLNVTGGNLSISGSLSAVGTSNTLGSLFTTGGNIGIGTTTPGNKFVVFDSSTSKDALRVIPQGVQTQFLGSIQDNTYSLGWEGNRWNLVYSANGTIQTSDSTLKNYIPLSYGLSELLNVETIKFRWKSQESLADDDPKKNFEYYGFRAENLAELFPELIYNENPDKQSRRIV